MRANVLTSNGCVWDTAGSILSLGRIVLKSISVILQRTLEADNLEKGRYRFFPGPHNLEYTIFLETDFS